MKKTYLDVAEAAGAAFFSKPIQGPIVMLNLLRFRAIANYANHPALQPAEPISGKDAYDRYMEATMPFLRKRGGEVLFIGKGNSFLIGPEDETWDCAILVKQNSLAEFLSFATDPEYLKILGHREAALEDSRLLPLEEHPFKRFQSQREA